MGGHLKVSSADKILMDNLMTSCRSIGISYMGLNEPRIWLIPLWLWGNILTLIFAFQKTFLLCFDHSKLDEVYFVNKDEALNLSSYYLIVLKFGFSSWLPDLLITTGLQLIILIIVLIWFLFSSCLWFVSACYTVIFKQSWFSEVTLILLLFL